VKSKQTFFSGGLFSWRIFGSQNLAANSARRIFFGGSFLAANSAIFRRLRGLDVLSDFLTLELWDLSAEIHLEAFANFIDAQSEHQSKVSK